nr:hypothetical protein [Tanacetum cinerariifolium]
MEKKNMKALLRVVADCKEHNTVVHTDMMQDAVTQELFSSRPGLQSGSTPHGDISRTYVCQSALPALNHAYLCLNSNDCIIRPEVISFPNRTEETRRQRHLPTEYLGDHAQIAQHEEASSSRNVKRRTMPASLKAPNANRDTNHMSVNN